MQAKPLSNPTSQNLFCREEREIRAVLRGMQVARSRAKPPLVEPIGRRETSLCQTACLEKALDDLASRSRAADTGFRLCRNGARERGRPNGRTPALTSGSKCVTTGYLLPCSIENRKVWLKTRAGVTVCEQFLARRVQFWSPNPCLGS